MAGAREGGNDVASCPQPNKRAVDVLFFSLRVRSPESSAVGVNSIWRAALSHPPQRAVPLRRFVDGTARHHQGAEDALTPRAVGAALRQSVSRLTSRSSAVSGDTEAAAGMSPLIRGRERKKKISCGMMGALLRSHCLCSCTCARARQSSHHMFFFLSFFCLA